MQKIYKKKSSIYISTDCQGALKKSNYHNYEAGQRLWRSYYGQVKIPREMFNDARKW